MSITGLKSNLSKFALLEGADRWLIMSALVWLAVARARLLASPFRRLFEQQYSEIDGSRNDPDAEFLRRVSYAVGAAANHVPWRSDCFPQTLAARMLLKRRGYNSTMHIGVERVGDDVLIGHAWLTCDDIVITGGTELHRYTELLAD